MQGAAPFVDLCAEWSEVKFFTSHLRKWSLQFCTLRRCSPTLLHVQELRFLAKPAKLRTEVSKNRSNTVNVFRRLSLDWCLASLWLSKYYFRFQCFLPQVTWKSVCGHFVRLFVTWIHHRGLAHHIILAQRFAKRNLMRGHQTFGPWVASSMRFVRSRRQGAPSVLFYFLFNMIWSLEIIKPGSGLFWASTFL